jgi:hypothetical protein
MFYSREMFFDKIDSGLDASLDRFSSFGEFFFSNSGCFSDSFACVVGGVGGFLGASFGGFFGVVGCLSCSLASLRKLFLGGLERNIKGIWEGERERVNICG